MKKFWVLLTLIALGFSLLPVSPAEAKVVPAKKQVIKSKLKPAAPKRYAHPEGLYAIRYPASWDMRVRKDAMILRSSGSRGSHGMFGIMRRSDDQSIDEAVMREFEAADRPADFKKRPAKVAGMPATKLLHSSKEDPDARVVEYYLENMNGEQFYILMVAPRKEWARYNIPFTAMLRSLRFN
jgi:hypothetical protein